MDEEVRSLMCSGTAAGPRDNVGALCDNCVLPRMSVDEPGVGGIFGCGIVFSSQSHDNVRVTTIDVPSRRDMVWNVLCDGNDKG